MHILKVNRLSKRIDGQTLVDDISFHIKRGEIFGLLGPNGAGKTTTIRMITGLIRPTEGSVMIGGHDLHQDRRHAIRQVGAIVESPSMYGYMSGLDNLRHFARMSSGVTEKRIQEVIEWIGLTDRIHDKVKKYSLGMKQRLGIGQCLLHNPSLLILDEPSNGLDPSGMRELRDLMRRLADQGTSILISSHLLGEVELVCDLVGVLDQGRWIKTVSVSELQGESSKQTRLHVYVQDAAKAHRVLRNSSIELHPQVESETVLSVDMPEESLNELLALLIREHVVITRVEERVQSLEDVFLELTGGERQGA